MKSFSQIAAIVAMNVRSLPDRLGETVVAVVGVATTVAVMTSLLALGAGLLSSANRNISPRQAIVLPAGAGSDYLGALPREVVPIVAAAPGVARSSDGQPLAQPVAMVVVELTKKNDGEAANVPVLGSGKQSRAMSGKFKIVAGRDYRPGLRELLVGRSALARYKGVAVGDRIFLRGSQWTVVGAFEDGGDISENGLLGDVETVLQGFGRNAYQNIKVQLVSQAALPAFRDALTSNPQLSVTVKSLRQHVQTRLKGVTSILNFVAYFVGVVMAIGAVVGAITTMYSAVDARRREIATLLALGFGGGVIMCSLTLESLLIAVPSAVLGAAIAWLLCTGETVTTFGYSFSMAVTPALLMTGVMLSLVIGLVGGVGPAFRAARIPVAKALREA